MAEGDSITAPLSVRYYASSYAATRPDVVFYNRAVGGSMLKNLIDRREANLALKPDVLTVFVGANGFGPDAQTYAEQVFDYVRPFRAIGTKVYIATVLPRITSSDTWSPALRNTERRKYAEIMQAAIGTKIDGIIDFGRAPIIGDDNAPLNSQLYGDGLHPSPRNANGGIGGHDYLFDLYKAAIDRALQSATR